MNHNKILTNLTLKGKGLPSLLYGLYCHLLYCHLPGVHLSFCFSHVSFFVYFIWVILFPQCVTVYCFSQLQSFLSTDTFEVALNLDAFKFTRINMLLWS